MDLSSIISIMGKPISDANVKNVLSSIFVDVDKDVDSMSDDFRVYVERPEEGFSLIFTDEAHFLNIPNQSIGVGERYFTGMFLYSEGKDGYAEFKSPLPKNLSFANSRDEALQKLGSPSWSRSRPDGSIVADRWDMSDHRMNLTYSKNNQITILSLTIPDAEG
jgi:hypothetical protein